MAATYALDYSALDRGWATQGAADYCAEHGHATYIRDGVNEGYCPRCLEFTAPRFVTDADRAVMEASAEFDA